jgi:hypothetical protein
MYSMVEILSGLIAQLEGQCLSSESDIASAEICRVLGVSFALKQEEARVLYTFVANVLRHLEASNYV